ncbi:MAG: UDP-2,3-diacylglucosamine diphosphatase [Gammaproteobacteria bacterium]|nr:UDP-2,3-diacylglucosamine diphosphatase [Gammaproteobacteria bacterium]
MKKYTVFISDTHLNEHEPAMTQRFLDFLKLNKGSIEKLYLLGDIFDTWIGDDDVSPLSLQVSQVLKNCAQNGVSIYFIHGNRDYLIGPKFAKSCGMKLLGEKTLLSLYGKQTLIMHGDLLCTDDLAYQRYRKIMFSSLMKKICLTLPLWLRKKIAKKLRKISQYSNSEKQMNIMDVSENSVTQAFAESNAELLIHGHTHRLACHSAAAGKTRMVLGAWEKMQGNAIIVNEKEAPRFIKFSQATTL